jgi:glycosyltransferase involved in cell wall biosynthesis
MPTGTEIPDEANSLSDEAVADTQKNKPLSLLFVVHGFPPAKVGGVEVYTRNLAIEAASRGVEVTVFYPVIKTTKPLYSFSSETVDGLTLTRFHVQRGHLWSNIVSDKIDRAFADYLRGQNFDIVHFHHIFNNLSLSMVEVAIKSAVPVAITLHDFWFICPRAHLFVETNMSICSGPDTPGKCADCILLDGLLPGVDRSDLERVIAFRHEYVRRLMANTDLLLAPSRFVAKTFDKHGFGGGRIAVAPLGIGKIAVQRSKRENGISFGYMGTIKPLKNVKMLLRAFSATRGEASLHLYGKGKSFWVNDMRGSISDPRITYHGKYTFEDLPEILAGIDILIVPSLIESYCFTVREALSVGIPVVAAKTGGIPEIIHDGVNGFLFDPYDDDELTRILQRFISDDNLLRKLDTKALPVTTIAADANFLISQYNMVKRRRKLAKKDHLQEIRAEIECLQKSNGLKGLLKKMERRYWIFKYGSNIKVIFKQLKENISLWFKHEK